MHGFAWCGSGLKLNRRRRSPPVPVCIFHHLGGRGRALDEKRDNRCGLSVSRKPRLGEGCRLPNCLRCRAREA